MITEFLDSKIGQIVISIILGLGLATIFRKVCTGNSCVVVKSPSSDDINKYYYKINQDCFKYNPVPVPCDGAAPS